MWERVLGRLAHAGAVMLASLTLSFALLYAAPGDALSSDTSQRGRSAEAREALRQRRGLDQPLAVQFTGYVARVLRGDLGRSFTTDRPVRAALTDALARTLLLTGSGLLAAIVLGMTVGILQGWRGDWWISRALGAALAGAYAMPEFVLAILLLSALSYGSGWFPSGGMQDPLVRLTGSLSARWLDTARHLVVPALTLALGWGAAVSRQQRAALLDTAAADFVRTARAKGVGERAVLFVHAVRPALPAVLAVIGLLLPVLAGGAVVVEAVFGWPGMGSLLLRAVSARDVPMVGGAILVTTAAVTMSSVCIDLAVQRYDPRQR